MGAVDPLIGTEVGNYRLSFVLGEGGMGRVYGAVQPKIAGRVAIKVLASAAPDLVARFFAEAKAVNLIKHPSIVKVHDLSYLPDGRPYIIMELIEGETLRPIVKRDSPLPIGGVLKVMSQALGALHAAHTIGIVHRDLKPDNLMVGFDGNAKVLDFGIAKLSPWLGDGLPRTVTGARVGTPAYMAPEQIRGTSVTAAADVYAAGVVLFEAVVGRRPFLGESEFELMKGHLEQSPPSPRSLRGDVPPELDQVILQALAKNPSDRFHSALAMANALGHVASVLPPEQQRPLVAKPGASYVVPRPAATPDAADPTVDVRSPGAGRTDTARTVSSRPDATAPMSAVARSSPWRQRRALLAAGIGLAMIAIVVVVVTAGRDARPASPTVTTGSSSPTPGPGPTPGPKPTQLLKAPGAPVVEELPSGGKRVTKPIDFDPATFDHVGYLPNARAFARTLLPDAELFTITSDAVLPDGTVKFGPQSSNMFIFVSPAATKVRSKVGRFCNVTMKITDKHVVASMVPTDACEIPLAKDPTCRFAQIWARARAKGVTGDSVSQIAWTMNSWLFFRSQLGEKPVTLKFDDRCN